jgi:hypothetical protein
MNMKMIDVTCDFCNDVFERSIGRANEAKRNGWKSFCSPECISNYRNKRIQTTCACCGKEIEVREKELKKSKNKRSFCSKSCAAKVNNVGRKYTNEHKLNISKGVLDSCKNREIHIRGTKNCVVCGKEFKVAKNNICCSRPCGQIHRFGSLPLTKEEVISQIQHIYENNGVAPSSKEVAKKLTHAAIRFFGSWNKAMKELDIKPNTQWMSKKRLTCKDGHIADSISERIVDEWLFTHGIEHERRKKYPGTSMDCDFYLTSQNVWLEYFGLHREHLEYDEKVEVKRKLAKEKGLLLLEVLPEHLYPEIKLEEVIPMS